MTASTAAQAAPKRKDPTAAERKARERADKRAQGLRPMEVWGFPEHHAQIKRYAAELAATHTQQR